MQNHDLQENWPQAKQQIKTKWNKLTDSDINAIDGSSEKLASRLQEHYGYSRERAEQECEAFCEQLEGAAEGSAGQASRPSPTSAGQQNPGGRSSGTGERFEQAKAGESAEAGGTASPQRGSTGGARGGSPQQGRTGGQQPGQAGRSGSQGTQGQGGQGRSAGQGNRDND